MNIVVRTYKGMTVVRPDTSWERYNRDYYVPDYVDALEWTPVLALRISRPGKCIASRFASRYFDACGSGILLFPKEMADISGEGYAAALCLDHTTVIPWPEHPLSELDDSQMTLASKALEDATQSSLVRNGDILAVELAPREILCRRTDGSFEKTVGDSSVKVIY